MGETMKRAKIPVAVALITVLALTAGAGVCAASNHSTHYVVLIDNTGTMKRGGRAAGTIEGLECLIDLTSPGDWVSVYRYGEAAKPVLSEYPVLIESEATKSTLKAELFFPFCDDRTDITAGMRLAWNERNIAPERHRSNLPSANSVVVLLTDGKLIPVYDDYSKYDRIYRSSRAELLELASRFGDAGTPIFTIGLGASERIDGYLLRQVAERSGGHWYTTGSPDMVADICREIVDAARPDAKPRGSGVEQAKAIVRSAEPAAIDSPCLSQAEISANSGPGGATESGPGTEHADEAGRPRASVVESIPDGLFERYAAALAVMVGVVAIGIERKQNWANVFSRGMFGTAQLRVRGYLKPMDPPGTVTARPNVGLENPGVETIKIGTGTPYVGYARNTIIEFLGTRDGTPPILQVESGIVKVDGKRVKTKKLSDGSTIEIEGTLYRYLRGNRR
jgi:hypothetical protein